MESPQQRGLISQLNRIAAGLFDRVEEIDREPTDIADLALAKILGFSCKAQSFGSITAGRAAARRIPANWLTQHLPRIAEAALDLGDEWEFRRLLELLKELESPLVEDYIALGLASNSPGIRAAAIDAQNR